MNLSRRTFARDLTKSLLYLAAGPAIVSATLDDVADTAKAQDVVPNRRHDFNSSGGGPEVLPVSGATAWWKANAQSLADGSTPSTWPDSTGNGHTLGTGSGSPTYRTNKQNGLPGFDFTAGTGTGFWIGPATGCDPGGTFTMFSVHWLADGTEHEVMQGTNCYWVLGSLSGNHAFYNGNGWFGSIAVVANKAVVVSIRQNQSSETKQRVNGVTGASQTGGTVGTWSRVCWGSLGCDIHSFNGFWFETVLYAGTELSLTDTASVENFLINKYAIS